MIGIILDISLHSSLNLDKISIYNLQSIYAHVMNRQTENRYIANPPTRKDGKPEKIKYSFNLK